MGHGLHFRQWISNRKPSYLFHSHVTFKNSKSSKISCNIAQKIPSTLRNRVRQSTNQIFSNPLTTTFSPLCTNCTKISNYYSSHTGITHEPYFKPLSRTRPKIPIYIEITHQIYHKISNQKSPKLPIKSTLLPLYSI